MSLIDDFVPSGGEIFNFLAAAGGITGAFDTINLPSLPLGLSWILNDDDPTMFQFTVIEGLPGDYNQDGTVDSADYVVWRKTDGTQSGFDTWRAHFGQTAGSSAIAELLSGTVPEPTSALLLVLGAAAMCCRRATRGKEHGPWRCGSVAVNRGCGA